MGNYHHRTVTRLLFGVLALLWSWFPLRAQTTLADSLEGALPQLGADTQRVQVLNDLAWEYKFDRPTTARQRLQEAIQLARTLGDTKGEAQAFNNWGVVETIHGQLATAQTHYETALQLREQLGDRQGVASLYNNIGNLKEARGDLDGALEDLLASLKIREALKDTIRMARASYNIGRVHEAMGNYSEALDYLFDHLLISETLADDYEVANAHDLLGNVKLELERFDEALGHHQRALQLRRALGDQWELAIAYLNRGNSYDATAEYELQQQRLERVPQLFRQARADYRAARDLYQSLEDSTGLSACYNNIGLLHKNWGSYYLDREVVDSARQQLDSALYWLSQSLDLRRLTGDRHGTMEVYNGIGDVRRRQGRWSEALDYVERYYALAQELGDPKFIQKAYKDFSRVYEKQGRYQLAYQYRKRYDELRYQRLSEDRVKLNLRREALFGDLRKQIEIERQRSEIQVRDAELAQASLRQWALLGGAAGLLLLALLLYNRYRLKSRANRELSEKNQIIEREQRRSEDLLLNILPAATARELKERGKAEAQHYASVSVLFTDFKSFTQVAEILPAEELVAELDECFRAFDRITAAHGVEKIKTIGDAYMGAAGLPQVDERHAEHLVAAALEMQAFMQEYGAERRREGRPAFEARIGIHSGPVVAGIVGSRKFAYDIWGDTVNTAARMESSGAVGRVNISAATYRLVKDRFVCSPRGRVAAKNKGEIEMYYVERKK